MIIEDTHHAYIEYVMRRNAREIRIKDKEFQYFDRKGNLISYGLYEILRADPIYTELRKDQIDNFNISTMWAPGKNIKMAFVTTVRDCNTEKTYQREYYTDLEAEKGHEQIVKEIINNTFEFPVETENKNST